MLLSSPTSPPVHREDDEYLPGVYLTDGRRLYRIVSRLTWSDGCHIASLEECQSLEVITFTADELHTMRLRLVHRGGCA